MPIVQMKQKIPANPKVAQRHRRISNVLAREDNAGRPMQSTVSLDNAWNNVYAPIDNVRGGDNLFHPRKVATWRINDRGDVILIKEVWEGAPDVYCLSRRRARP